MSKKTWNHRPAVPIVAPKQFKDILTLTAIALDRGLITEAELHQIIKEKTE